MGRVRLIFSGLGTNFRASVAGNQPPLSLQYEGTIPITIMGNECHIFGPIHSLRSHWNTCYTPRATAVHMGVIGTPGLIRWVHSPPTRTSSEFSYNAGSWLVGGKNFWVGREAGKVCFKWNVPVLIFLFVFRENVSFIHYFFFTGLKRRDALVKELCFHYVS